MPAPPQWVEGLADQTSRQPSMPVLEVEHTHSQSYLSSRGAVLRTIRAILAILTLIFPVRPLTQTNNIQQKTKHNKHLALSTHINTTAFPQLFVNIVDH